MKLFNSVFTFLSGICNGIFGTGGGIITVNVLKNRGIKQKEAQATALAVTFLMSVLSCFYYLFMGYFKIKDALIYIPFGIIGSILGSFLLSKISNRILKKLFALFIIWAGVRMIT